MLKDYRKSIWGCNNPTQPTPIEAMKVIRLSKFLVRMSTTSFTPMQNLKSFVRTRTLSAGTWLLPKRDRPKFLTLHSPFCLLIIKKYWNWMAILSTLKSTSLDETNKCALKWFIVTLKTSSVGKSQACEVCNLRTTHTSILKLMLNYLYEISPFPQVH